MSDVNAVTWGVFPAKEVIQPTVVDPQSFMVWKDEAFDIWTSDWASIYPDDSPSKKVLQEVREHHAFKAASTDWLANTKRRLWVILAMLQVGPV